MKLFSCAVFAALALSACDPAGEVVSGLDGAIDSLDHSVYRVTNQASSVKDVIKALPASLRQNAANLLENDVSQTLGATTGKASTALYSVIEFANLRLLNNLQTLADGLRQERNRIQKGGSFDGTLESVIRKVAANTEETLPPKVTGVSPDSLRVDVNSRGSITSKPEDKIVRYYGWGFRSKGVNLHCEALGPDGKPLMNLDREVTVLTSYSLSVPVERLFALKPETLKGARLALWDGNKTLSEMPVSVMIAPPAPPPPPVTHTVRFDRVYCHESGDSFFTSVGEPAILVCVDGGEQVMIFSAPVREGESSPINRAFTFKERIDIHMIELDTVDTDDDLGVKTLSIANLDRNAMDWKSSGSHFVVTYSVL